MANIPPQLAAQLAALQGAADAGGGQVGTIAEMADLTTYVAAGQASVLNADPKSDLLQVLKGKGLLKSDADVDHQLIVHIPFNEAVKLHDIIIKADTHDNKEESSGPLLVKLYVDRPHLDFAEAESAKAVQDLQLTDADLSGRKIPLKFVKFQNVHSLTIFIESNQGDTDVTFLNHIGFIGCPIAGTNMGELKKIEHEH